MANKVVEIAFQSLPKNVEELKALPEASLDTPYKAAALAVLVFVRYGESVEDALQMLEFLNGPRDMTKYDEQFLRDRLRGKEYVPWSYFVGTTPDNDYTVQPPYVVRVSDNPYSYQADGYATLYITSSGADSPRPIKLRQKDDKWFVWEQMLLADIRKPKRLSDW